MKRLKLAMAMTLAASTGLLGGCAANGTGNTLMGKPVHWGVFEKDMNKVVDLTGGYQGDPAYIRVNYESNQINGSILKVGNHDLAAHGLVNDITFENTKDSYAATVKPGKTTLVIRCRPAFGVGSSRDSAWGEPKSFDIDLQPNYLYSAQADQIIGDWCNPVVHDRKFNYKPKSQ
jgi:hypothetical protein